MGFKASHYYLNYSLAEIGRFGPKKTFLHVAGFQYVDGLEDCQQLIQPIFSSIPQIRDYRFSFLLLSIPEW